MTIRTNYEVIAPGEGRDYATASEAQQGFLDGHIFRWRDSNISIIDFDPNVKVQIRYEQNNKVIVFTVPAPVDGVET